MLRGYQLFAHLFPYCKKEWNQLNDGIKKIESIKKFKTSLIKIIRIKENSVFRVSEISCVKLLTCLRLNFSHYLMRCRLYSVQRAELLDGVYKLDSTLQNSLEDQLLTVLLYGSEKFA